MRSYSQDRVRKLLTVFVQLARISLYRESQSSMLISGTRSASFCLHLRCTGELQRIQVEVTFTGPRLRPQENSFRVLCFCGPSRSPQLSTCNFLRQFTTNTNQPTNHLNHHNNQHTHHPTCLSPRRTASPASTRRPTPPAPACKFTRTAPRSRPQRP